jgi:hypothetical protein
LKVSRKLQVSGKLATGIMPRRDVQFVRHGYYHIYNRGAGQHDLFVEKDNYLYVLHRTKTYIFHLCRYLHASPVKDGIVERLDEWPYSNYLEWVGARRGTLVDHQFVTDMFGDAASYTAFVLEYLQSRRLPDELECLKGYSRFPETASTGHRNRIQGTQHQGETSP